MGRRCMRMGCMRATGKMIKQKGKGYSTMRRAIRTTANGSMINLMGSGPMWIKTEPSITEVGLMT